MKRSAAATACNQRRNVRSAAEALTSITEAPSAPTSPLDVLDAEAEGQTGYLIEQETRNVLAPAGSA